MAEDYLMFSFQVAVGVAVSVFGFFLRRVISQSDRMSAKMIACNLAADQKLSELESDITKRMGLLSEKTVRLETKNDAVNTTLSELKTKITTSG